MKELPTNLSRIIFNTKTLSVKLKVILENTVGGIKYFYHNDFSYGNARYFKLSPSAYITVEYTNKQNGEGYDPSKNISITYLKWYQFIEALRRMRHNIHKPDIFVMKGNEIILYDDVKKDNIVSVHIGNNTMVMSPAIIYDANEVSYEGVYIYINKTINIIELSVDEFESFVYQMEKVDIFAYSQSLINYYVSYYKDDIKDRIDEKKIVKNNYNDFQNNQSEFMISNIIKDTDDIMSGI